MAASYSVWNAQTNAYDYYEAPVPISDAPPNPSHLRQKDLGVAVTRAGWPLPPGSKWVGRGETARGQIATPLGDDDGGGMANNGILALLALGAAYLLWKKR